MERPVGSIQQGPHSTSIEHINPTPLLELQTSHLSISHSTSPVRLGSFLNWRSNHTLQTLKDFDVAPSLFTKDLTMKIALFLLPLAFLTATSDAEEFPNPCKRSDMLSGSRVPERVVAPGRDLQISAKFAAVVVSYILGHEAPD